MRSAGAARGSPSPHWYLPPRYCFSCAGNASWRSASVASQRAQEADQVVDLGLGELERLEDALAVGVDSIQVQVGVKNHHLAKGRYAAVVHVRRGQLDVAQARHAEFAEVAVLRVDVLRRHRARARGIVVEAAEQVE